MNLQEAMQALKDGKRVRPISWSKDSFVEIIEGKIVCCFYVLSLFNPTVDELFNECKWILDDDEKKLFTLVEIIHLLESGSRCKKIDWNNKFIKMIKQDNALVLVKPDIFDITFHYQDLIGQWTEVTTE